MENQTQFCKGCKTNRPLHFFVNHGNKPTKSCSACRDKYSKQYARKRSVATIDDTQVQVSQVSQVSQVAQIVEHQGTRIALEDVGFELKHMKGSSILEYQRFIDINKYSKEPKVIAKIMAEHV